MSLQLKSIILYNKKGETRKLEFNTGAVNIITGMSDTGKSAIIAILEYCLGQSKCEIPDGVIRNTVMWYAVLYQLDDTQIFVAKPAPTTLASKYQSQVYLEIDQNINIPKMSELKPNATDDSITSSISALLGISPNLSLTGIDKRSDAYEVHVRHATHYLFQESDVIASKHLLFHKQLEDWGPKTIKSTLPYFLGVLQEDRLRIENQLLDARRAERAAQRKISEVEAISSDRLDKGKSLLAEAQQAGLIPDELDETNIESILSALRKTQSWRPKQAPAENVDLVNSVRDEIQILRQSIKEKSQQISIVEKYINDANGYSGEVGYQAERLTSINIFDEHNFDVCPVCQSNLASKNIPSTKSIKHTLDQLNLSLQMVKRERPKLEGYLKQLNLEKDQLIQKIDEKKNQLIAIESESNVFQEIKDENARVARVIGRISFYLEHLNIKDELQPLRIELEKAQGTVQFLETQLGPELIDERQNSILNLISHWMTEWAKLLNLEYSKDFHYQFDLKNLTVQANLPDRTVPMINMGGGKNILGCHIITLLALHKYFVTQKRPVPGFIILDQPTQGFFVSVAEYKKRVDSGSPEQISKDDRENIQNLFKLIFDVCAQLAPNFQVIILEHTHLSDETFKKAQLEESWNRTERALIPPSWLETEEK